MSQIHNSGAAGSAGGDATAEEVVAKSGLPSEVQAVIGATVRSTRLWKYERADVARELLAHFRDGLDRGETASDLVARFGEPKAAGRRMGKAAREKRHWLWHVQKRVGQGALLLVAGLAVTYGALWIRFATGSPTIARNYTAELNAPVLATPESDRAWMVYRPAIIAIQPVMREHEGWEDVMFARPNTPEFERAKAASEAFAPYLATIRRGAEMATLGYVLTDTGDPELARAQNGDFEPSPPSENPPLNGVLLDPLAPLQSLSRVLAMDANIAASEGDGERAVADIVAMLGIARQANNMPFLVSDLVGIAIANRAWDTASELILRYPQAFTDAHIDELIRHIASNTGDRAFRADPEPEKTFFEDTLQRIYTDDGHGDGRLTPEGMRYLASLASWSRPESVEQSAADTLFAPAKMAYDAGRKAARDRYYEMIDTYAKFRDTPMWMWTQLPDAEFVKWAEDNRSTSSVVAMLMPVLSSVLTAENWSHMRNDVGVAGLALEQFRRANGRYPPTLDDLVPAYMASVPTDIGDGKPIRYRLEDGKPVIYSVGVDRVDNDGRSAMEGQTPVRRQGWRDPAMMAQWRASGQLPNHLDGDVVLWPSGGPSIVNNP